MTHFTLLSTCKAKGSMVSTCLRHLHSGNMGIASAGQNLAILQRHHLEMWQQHPFAR